MVTVKRVGVMSAFKIGAILSMLMWVVFGLCFLGLEAAAFSMTSTSVYGSAYGGSSLPSLGGGTLALGSLFLFYLCGVVIYGIIGGIAGAIYAFLYNFAARTFGGIELELASMDTRLPTLPGEKPKRIGEPSSDDSKFGF